MPAVWDISQCNLLNHAAQTGLRPCSRVPLKGKKPGSLSFPRFTKTYNPEWAGRGPSTFATSKEVPMIFKKERKKADCP